MNDEKNYMNEEPGAECGSAELRIPVVTAEPSLKITKPYLIYDITPANDLQAKLFTSDAAHRFEYAAGMHLEAKEGLEKFPIFPDLFFDALDHPEHLDEYHKQLEGLYPFYGEDYLSELTKRVGHGKIQDAKSMINGCVKAHCVYDVNEFPARLYGDNRYLDCKGYYRFYTISPFFPKDLNCNSEFIENLETNLCSLIRLFDERYLRHYSVKVFDAEHTLGIEGKTITIVLATESRLKRDFSPFCWPEGR